jgi:hypothetical protein
MDEYSDADVFRRNDYTEGEDDSGILGDEEPPEGSEGEEW